MRKKFNLLKWRIARWPEARSLNRSSTRHPFLAQGISCEKGLANRGCLTRDFARPLRGRPFYNQLVSLFKKLPTEVALHRPSTRSKWLTRIENHCSAMTSGPAESHERGGVAVVIAMAAVLSRLMIEDRGGWQI